MNSLASNHLLWPLMWAAGIVYKKTKWIIIHHLCTCSVQASKQSKQCLARFKQLYNAKPKMYAFVNSQPQANLLWLYGVQNHAATWYVEYT